MNNYVETSREPLRPVVDDRQTWEACLAALSEASGPVAFDAERAHGHRYWPKAYLFQIRREGAGTWLIDPIALERIGKSDLSELVEATGGATWLVHAASQDLPCMREVGIQPEHLFDTELGARILGEPQVSLGVLLEEKLGIRLRKAHSAQNWATRPLPEDWLIYAALDVDYLLELADVIHEELDHSGRLEWAEQEFRATLDQFREAPAPRVDPWRRTSGITGLRSTRQFAIARALWQERDQIAQSRDRPPSHILPDDAIVQLASRSTPDQPWPTPNDFEQINGFRRRGALRYRNNWRQAVAGVKDLAPEEYPAKRPVSTGLPHPRSWDRSNPEAAKLWPKVRSAVDELACELLLQPSIIAPPAILQHVVYHHAGIDDYAAALSEQGARPWQVEFLAPLLEDVAG